MNAITFKPVDQPIKDPVTKFGGQPNWITKPEWPLSRSTGQPMCFIGQIEIPDSVNSGEQKMAYIFMTDDADVDGTWDPELGENAVILQPAPFEPSVETQAITDGPTVMTAQDSPPGFFGKLRGEKPKRINVPIEYEVELTPHTFDEEDLQSRVAGEPLWLQYDETPDEGNWSFLAQIDSVVPFYVNFGDCGVAYVLVREDGQHARFIWQCC